MIKNKNEPFSDSFKHIDPVEDEKLQEKIKKKLKQRKKKVIQENYQTLS
jgi:hypothetical protein